MYEETKEDYVFSKYKKVGKSKGNKIFQNFLADSCNCGFKTFNPRELFKLVQRSFLGFQNFGQQDAQEFMSFLLDGLSEGELLKIKKEENPANPAKSYIDEIYKGYTHNILFCLNCKSISRTFSPFMYLSLAMPGSKKMR